MVLMFSYSFLISEMLLVLIVVLRVGENPPGSSGTSASDVTVRTPAMPSRVESKAVAR